MIDPKKVAATAYQEMVIQHGRPSTAMSLFQHNRDQLVSYAKVRVAQLGRVAKQCFLSKHEMEFWQQALATPAPAVVVKPAAAQTASLTATDPSVIITPEDKEDMTSKLKGLAGLTKSIVAQVETEAEAAVTNLQTAKDNAMGGIGKIKSVADEMNQSAKDMNDFANQITNGGPPLDQ